MPISKTRFPDGVGQATQVNPETADTGKPVNKFDGRKNMDAGTYELRAERDFGERIYRYWHRAQMVTLLVGVAIGVAATKFGGVALTWIKSKV